MDWSLVIASLLVFCHITSSQSSESIIYNGPKFQLSQSECYRPVPDCIPLNSTTQCLDVTLPYRYTFPPVLSKPGQTPEQVVHQHLSQWRSLRAIPQCWNALQSALCASFFPRCESGTGGTWVASSNHSSSTATTTTTNTNTTLPRLALPTDQMCRNVRSRCRLVDRLFQWPDFLSDCGNRSLFSSHKTCANQYTEFRFNQSKHTDVNRCVLHSLVSTDERSLWYPDIDGCALRCDPNPVYTAEQHHSVQSVILHGSAAAFLLALFVVLTFLFHFSSTRYPSYILFHQNICLALSYLGWWAQHVVGRSPVVCRADNSARLGVQTGHFYCMVSFTVLYYFSMVALHWMVLFAWACTVTYRTTGSSCSSSSRSSRHDQLVSKRLYFHVIAWTVPFVLTLALWFNGQIDGDSLYGVCFVGLANRTYWVWFVFVPLCIGVVAILAFFTRVLVHLWDMRRVNLKDENPERRKHKCNKIIRMFYRVVIVMACVAVGFVASMCLIYHRSTLTEQYNHQLNNYIICSLNITDILKPKYNSTLSEDNLSGSSSSLSIDIGDDRCAPYRPKPDLWPIYWQLCLIFGTSVLGIIWVCSQNTLFHWKRCLRKLARLEFCRHQWKRATRKRLTAPIEDDKVDVVGDEAGVDNNNGHNNGQKRRKVTSGTTVPTNYTNYHWPHFDPVEMDFSSIASQSLIHSIKDRFNKILTRSGMESSRKALNSTGGSAQSSIAGSTTNAGQSFSDASSVSQLQMNGQSQQPPIEMTNVVSVKHRDNLQRRRRNKKMVRTVKRRGSESSLSTAFIAVPKSGLFNGDVATANKVDTKSTSTGDLMSGLVGVMPSIAARSITPLELHAQSQPQFYSFAPNLITPFLTPPGMHFGGGGVGGVPTHVPQPLMQPQSFGHNLSTNLVNVGQTHQIRPNLLPANLQPLLRPPSQPTNQPPTPINPFPCPRLPSDIKQSGYTFTHCMDDQSDGKLVLPFEEKRRPGSSLATTNANTVTVPPTANELPQNFTLNTLSSNQAAIGGESAAVMAVNPFCVPQFCGPRMPYAMPPMYAAPMMNGFGMTGYAARPPLMFQPRPRQIQCYNTVLAEQYHMELAKQNLTTQEMQQLMAERQALAHLVTATRADSSADNHSVFLAKNIVISDSEYASGLSDSSRLSQYPEFVQSAIEASRLEVEQRIKRVEQDQEETQKGQKDHKQTNEPKRPNKAKTKKKASKR